MARLRKLLKFIFKIPPLQGSVEEFTIFLVNLYKVKDSISIMGDIFFKIHKSYRLVVAICDKDIYGRKLVEGIRQLDLTGPFFQGDEVDGKELKERIVDAAKEDATFNIVGEKSIKIAKELEIIKDEGVIEIEGVPFALVLS